MSFNSFFSKFGNNSSAGTKIYDNQAIETAPAASAAEGFVLPDESEHTFESREESVETEKTIDFDDGIEVLPDVEPTLFAHAEPPAEDSTPFEKSACLDESDPDALLELDDLFDCD
jgi:hypothetical protein